MRFRIAVLLLSFLTACGGGGGSNVTPTSPAASPATPPSTTVPDEPLGTVDSSAWQMQSGDVQRNGYQPNSSISSTTAAGMQLAWTVTLDDNIQASPVIAGGRVYVATKGGGIVALDQSTGNIIWSIPAGTIGTTILGTPSIDGNTLIVPVYTPSGVVALDTSTGAILWKRASSDWGGGGPVRTEPLITGGLVYVGTAGGDPPSGCKAGTVAALSELTGAVAWTFRTTTNGNGIGIWSPISLTPFGDVVFGTGNSCVPGLKYNDSVVALDAKTGVVDWDAAELNSNIDDDVGGGIAVDGSRGFFTGKNAKLYGIDLSNGMPLWTALLPSKDGFGSTATPATDGNNVISQTGAFSDVLTNPSPQSALVDYSPSGTLLWTAGPFQLEENSSPLITNDVVVVGVDGNLEVRSLKSGALIWAWYMGSVVYASPAVLGNMVFITSYGTGSAGGVVTAFSPTSSSNARSRRIQVQVHPTRPLHPFRPWNHDDSSFVMQSR